MTVQVGDWVWAKGGLHRINWIVGAVFELSHRGGHATLYEIRPATLGQLREMEGLIGMAIKEYVDEGRDGGL